MDKKDIKNSLQEFPPVVSVLGHVDHGKTSLLDKIRSTGIAEREHGGITQKIGASEIEIKHEGKTRRITFIDTPGHEAFANMRSQGVNAADIVLLVIAADDGVMPQTRESISKILEAKIPYIVVFTKIDREGVNIERIKQQVAADGILLEGLGGNVPFTSVSSKTGENVKELLDLVLLVYDLSGIRKDSSANFLGVVIDSKQDKKKGAVATVVVKSGTITVSNLIYSHGEKLGKARAIMSSNGKNIQSAIVGDAVEILGLSGVLPSGTVISTEQTEPESSSTAVSPPAGGSQPGSLALAGAGAQSAPADLAQFLRDEKPDFVPVVLKTESAAELEAIKNVVPSKVRIIYDGQGEISVSDILMAKDFRALVLGFNVGINREAENLAQNEKVFYKSYNIIYQLLEELATLIVTLEEGEVERELGKGEILASFLGTSGAIIGLKVVEGRLAVSDKIRIMRGEKTLGASKITSIRHGRQDLKAANKNMECGIMIEGEVDFAPQDVIIAYKS